MILHHCPSNCHTHPVQDYPGVASGSFAAPDHEYPSYLELRLTATDSAGLTDVESVRLDPKTVDLHFASVAVGAHAVAEHDLGRRRRSPARSSCGRATASAAPSPQTLGGTSYSFASWSDGGAATHDITATASATYTATYRSP